MSRSRVHDLLSDLFQLKEPKLLIDILEHEDYSNFMKNHGIQMDVKALVVAFTHTSFSHEYSVANQEKLEFLGDSVLQLIVTEELFKRYPDENEGKLSKLRSSIVNEKTLALIAQGLHLGDLIIVGKGEYMKNLILGDSVLADTLEALLGQTYRHQGFDFTKKLCLGWLEKFAPGALEKDFLAEFDSKSKLQELSLSLYKKLPQYVSEPKGDQFEVKLLINDELMASGMFSSKKNGEKELAQNVLKKGLI
jgi:ribonuclease-3